MQRTLAALLVVAGLVLGGWTILDRTGDDIGSIDVAAPTSPTPSPAVSQAPTSPPAASPSPSPVPTPPPIARTSGRIEDVLGPPAPAPTSISLPTISVDAPVVPVGVEPDGSMTIPEDVSTVGWYRYGPSTTAEAGSVVIAGHVDDRVQGRGALFDLRAVEVGDPVTVTDEDGQVTTWTITGRQTFEKVALPIDELFRRDGPHRLVLVTCGGEFDTATRSYESNVVVVAEPAP